MPFVGWSAVFWLKFLDVLNSTNRIIWTIFGYTRETVLISSHWKVTFRGLWESVQNLALILAFWTEYSTLRSKFRTIQPEARTRGSRKPSSYLWSIFSYPTLQMEMDVRFRYPNDDEAVWFFYNAKTSACELRVRSACFRANSLY